MQTKFAFMGLVLGSIFTLFKHINNQKKNIKYIIFLFLSFCVSLLLIYLEKSFLVANINNLSFTYLFICGFLMSIGVVIPRCQ